MLVACAKGESEWIGMEVLAVPRAGPGPREDQGESSRFFRSGPREDQKRGYGTVSVLCLHIDRI